MAGQINGLAPASKRAGATFANAGQAASAMESFANWFGNPSPTVWQAAQGKARPVKRLAESAVFGA